MKWRWNLSKPKIQNSIIRHGRVLSLCKIYEEKLDFIWSVYFRTFSDNNLNISVFRPYTVIYWSYYRPHRRYVFNKSLFTVIISWIRILYSKSLYMEAFENINVSFILQITYFVQRHFWVFLFLNFWFWMRLWTQDWKVLQSLKFPKVKNSLNTIYKSWVNVTKFKLTSSQEPKLTNYDLFECATVKLCNF